MAPTLPEIAVERIPPAVVRAPTGGHSSRSSGRDEVVARVLDACADRSTAPVVAITGPPGIGRSSVLALVRVTLTELGVDTRDIQLPGTDVEPRQVVALLADGLGLPPARGESSRATLDRLLAALTERQERLVVFLDDAHRLGREACATLLSLVETLRGTRVTVVCAVRGSLTHPVTGLMTEERLRPLSVAAVERMLTELLRARPEPGMAASIRRASRGVPAVLHAAVEGYQRSGCLRVVDRHAYLVARGVPQLPSTHPLFTDLRRLGTSAWSVLKAVAVLHPLRGDVPALTAEATGIGEEVVREALRDLHSAGVLLPTRHGNWRFRVPVLAVLLDTCLGPYERRRIAQVAVTALWTGRASCPDDDYLPNRLVDAGGLVDRDRAAAELLAHANAARPEDAIRWRPAAARAVTDPARRAAVLHRHAVTCALHQRFRPALAATDVVLRELPDQLPPDSLRELRIIHVVALASTGDDTAVRELAGDGRPGDDHQAVHRAVALCMLNRWQDAHDLLAANREHGDRTLGQVLARAVGALVTGTSDRPSVATSGAVQRVLARTLTLAGDTVVAPEIQAARTGRWDLALDLTRADIASAQVHGHGPERTAMFLTAAEILTARGQLSRARTLTEHARSQHLLVPHLLALPEAELQRTLGEPEQAMDLLAAGLDLAAESGAMVGTDELRLALARMESQRGNLVAAGRHAARTEQISRRLGTSGARRSHLLARLLVAPDPAAAAEAVELAEASGNPYDLAGTLVAATEAGLTDVKRVRQAYEIFGELDALLPRARLRALMRARGISVPGRRETVAENERLLVGLIAEGLANAALATVLGTSEKSVEGQLTRFFKRTGYRSRTEVAAVVLRSAPSRSAGSTR